jgi:hypothetical protein
VEGERAGGYYQRWLDGVIPSVGRVARRLSGKILNSIDVKYTPALLCFGRLAPSPGKN